MNDHITLPPLRSATTEEFPRFETEHPDLYNERLKLLQRIAARPWPLQPTEIEN